MVKTKKSKLKKYVKKSCKKSKLRKLKRTRKNIRKKFRAGSKRLGLGGMKRQRPPSSPTTPVPKQGPTGTPFNTDGREQAEQEAAAERAAREAGDLPDGSGTPLDPEGQKEVELRDAARAEESGNARKKNKLNPRELFEEKK